MSFFAKLEFLFALRKQKFRASLIKTGFISLEKSFDLFKFWSRGHENGRI